MTTHEPTPQPTSDPRPVVRCGIVPPYLLEALATSGEPHLEQRARETLRLDRLRYEDHAREHALRPDGTPVSRRANRATTEAPNRVVHDAAGGTDLPGTKVRGEGDPASDDTAVNEAYDGLGATWDLWNAAYGRNSLDDKGLGLVATVHYGKDYDNAFWDGSQMVFGDGDGVVLLGFTRSLDVIGHEARPRRHAVHLGPRLPRPGRRPQRARLRRLRDPRQAAGARAERAGVRLAHRRRACSGPTSRASRCAR